MAEPIISVSGLRGIIGSELTPRVAMDYAAAFASTLPHGKIVVGRDGRISGSMFAQAISAALTGHGLHVVDADVIATPTLGVLVRNLRAVGGIQISASHNPPVYNGLKLFNRDGRVIPADDGAVVLDAYLAKTSRYVPVEQLGTSSLQTDAHQPHLNAVLSTIDTARIRERRFRVLLDSNHGAGSILGRRLLEALDCEVTLLGESPDGRFAHPPEPTAENLVEIASRVASAGFDIGFCQDPDADRLAIIDEKGVYIGEEYTSVLCAWRRMEKSAGPLVTNCASSSLMSWLADQHSVAFYRSKVGEANVVDTMLKYDAAYGGEGSGGPIDPKVGFVRDSFVGMAQVLELMAVHRLPLSELVDELPRWSMLKDKVVLNDSDRATAQSLWKEAFADAKLDQQDGLRFDWADRWLLMRGSNTEPIVRIIAEAPTSTEAADLVAQAKLAIHSV
jgi:phosphomannomutase